MKHEVGLTIDEAFLKAEKEARSLEQQGKEMFVQGVLARGKVYAEYIAEGHSQREAAKFFNDRSRRLLEYIYSWLTVFAPTKSKKSLQNLKNQVCVRC